MEKQDEKMPIDEENKENESSKESETLNDYSNDDLLSIDEFPIFESSPYNPDASFSSLENISQASTPELYNPILLPSHLRELWPTNDKTNETINAVPSTSSSQMPRPRSLWQGMQLDEPEKIAYSDNSLPSCQSIAKKYPLDHPSELKTHQLQYLHDKVIPFLLEHLDFYQPRGLLFDCNSEYPEDTLVMEKIVERLKTNFYKKARECIADIDKMFLQFYLQRHYLVFLRAEMHSVQEGFHEMIIDMEWKKENSDRSTSTLEDESPYFNPSMVNRVGAGRFDPQLKYLCEVVIPNLRAQPYAFLLQRSQAKVGEASSSNQEETLMITLDIIQERLSSFFYMNAEECIHDVDEFFMDSYVHKFTGVEYLPMIALLQENFHGEIMKMPRDFDDIVLEAENGIIERKVFCPLEFIRDYVLNPIWKHEYAMPFQSANDLKEYLEILMPKGTVVEEELMTLGKIKKRLENNEYKTINECIQDFDLMFRKILQPELSDQLIYFQAQELKEIFEQKIEKLPRI